jgi:hypothetical protein
MLGVVECHDFLGDGGLEGLHEHRERSERGHVERAVRAARIEEATRRMGT